MGLFARHRQAIMSAIELRPAIAADLPRLVEIYNHYVRETPVSFDIESFTVDQRAAWFEQFAETGRHRLFVAEQQGKVVGYAGTHPFRTKPAYATTVETTVYCDPGSLRRGIGAALYRELFEALRAEDIRSFIAGITLPNEASIALHERFGFTLAGTMREVGRKFGTYWHVGWYERLVPARA
jgi:phosphinothricin acetyltransferase